MITNRHIRTGRTLADICPDVAKPPWTDRTSPNRGGCPVRSIHWARTSWTNEKVRFSVRDGGRLGRRGGDCAGANPPVIYCPMQQRGRKP